MATTRPDDPADDNDDFLPSAAGRRERQRSGNGGYHVFLWLDAILIGVPVMALAVAYATLSGTAPAGCVGFGCMSARDGIVLLTMIVFPFYVVTLAVAFLLAALLHMSPHRPSAFALAVEAAITAVVLVASVGYVLYA